MSSSQRIPTRAQVATTDRWDLTDLYGSDDEWTLDFRAAEKAPDALAAFRGRFGDGPEVLARFLDARIDAMLRLERLVEYASRSSDVDTASSHYLGLKQRALALLSQLAAATSFFPAELLALPDDVLDAYLDHEAIAPHRFNVQKILRDKPYTLSPGEERILAMAQEVTRAPFEAFDQLSAADLTFASVRDADDNELLVNHGSIISLLSHAQRPVRRAAFEAYHRGYADHSHAMAATLHAAVRAAAFHAHARGFDNTRQAALHTDAIPEAVYDNLVATVYGNVEPLRQYLELLRTTLGQDDLAAYDLMAPILPGIPLGRTYDDAVELVTAALAPLGDEYTRTLHEGLRSGWVDRYPNKGKASGAYSAGAYGSRPYILLNFGADDIDHVYTLAHEGGHSMHTVYAHRMQPPQYASYSIFVAEVASTFNEVLLTEHLLQTHDDPRLRAMILNRELSALRSLIFRQTSFADFEHRIHRDVEEGRPLTLDRLTDTYHDVLARLFGPAYTINPLQDFECLRIPHFYFGFYVYQYATGVSAALALSQRVLAGDESAREAYLQFLGLGGSVDPLEALAHAGVDMASPQPVIAALDYFGRRVEALRSVLTWLD